MIRTLCEVYVQVLNAIVQVHSPVQQIHRHKTQPFPLSNGKCVFPRFGTLRRLVYEQAVYLCHVLLFCLALLSLFRLYILCRIHMEFCIDRIKEHDRDIRLAHTQTSAVSEHANETGHLPLWNQVKFIDRDPHRYTRRVKEAIQIRLHSNNINRDNGIEIPEAWMPTIRKHNSRSTTKRTPEGTSSASRNNEDRNTPITANQRA